MAVTTPSLLVSTPPDRIGRGFAIGFLMLVGVAAGLSVYLPLSVAFGAVFLFAGPHNLLEFRYVLGRLPARAGRLWSFFLWSGLGIVGLTLAYAALPWLSVAVPRIGRQGYAVWSMALIWWVCGLIWQRSLTNPRFDAGWVWAVACFLTAGVWLKPLALPLTAVYLHPLMALWLLDREIARSRPEWKRGYRVIALTVPLAILFMWGQLREAPELPGADQITIAFGPTVRAETLTDHAGAWALPGISPYFLVATHTFLELVHYGIWVVLIPAIGLRSAPWDWNAIPAARRGPQWSRAVGSLLLLSLLLVGVLWVCFGIDYESTRRIYFTVAMLHVLAEIPFLLRMV